MPWLGWTDGTCRYCASGRENLCDRARFTGYDIDGGYAELAVADERFCFPIPPDLSDEQAAPLLCAGLIGYRALRLVGDAERIGFYGFGASAHILCQLAVHQGRRVFVFTREGDEEGQAFRREASAPSGPAPPGEAPPEELDGAIVFAPVGSLMTEALRVSAKGARIVSAGIHMSDIPSFPYEQLWGERTLGSVANLTRRDGEEFLDAGAAGADPDRGRGPPAGGRQRGARLDSHRRPSRRRRAPASGIDPRREGGAWPDGAGAVLGGRRSAPGRGLMARPRTMRLVLSRTRSAAAAAWSAIAIRVASSSWPLVSVRPRQSSRGVSPAHPIATSTWPSRHARPKLSEITTAMAESRG